MSIEDLIQFSPQKTFLIQGQEPLFDELSASALQSDPGTFALSVSRLTIEYARSIALFAQEGSGEKRICVCYFSFCAPEAAQVLLKALEEPDLHTIIILITNYPYLVPQTIRSRVMLIGQTDKARIEIPFLTREDAFLYIKKEFDTGEEEAATRRAKAITFLDALEEYSKNKPEYLEKVYEAKHMLMHANLPTKYVLEYAVSIIF